MSPSGSTLVYGRGISSWALFAIAAFMLAYNGTSEPEMWLDKAAAVSAIGVAMFPCQCGDLAREILPRVHLLSAGVMFAVLACFCYIFYRRAREKGRRRANWRAVIYSVTGTGMLGSIGLFAAYAIADNEALVIWGETLGLVSFGIAWLTASKVLPVITDNAERQELFVMSKHAPPHQ